MISAGIPGLGKVCSFQSEELRRTIARLKEMRAIVH
jgi:hypothetical protein